MSIKSTICEAIAGRRLLSLNYAGGRRTVEPHQLGYTSPGNLALSGWQTSGHSQSGESSGWKIMLVESMTQVRVLDDVFPAPRPGYKPAPNDRIQSAVCEV